MDDYDEVVGRELPDTGESLTLVLSGGQAGLFPSSFRRMSPDAQDALMAVQASARMIAQLRDEIEATIPMLRRQGASWGLIGHAVGMTDKGAQRRFGGLEDTPEPPAPPKRRRS